MRFQNNMPWPIIRVLMLIFRCCCIIFFFFRQWRLGRIGRCLFLTHNNVGSGKAKAAGCATATSTLFVGHWLGICASITQCQTSSLLGWWVRRVETLDDYRNEHGVLWQGVGLGVAVVVVGCEIGRSLASGVSWAKAGSMTFEASSMKYSTKYEYTSFTLRIIFAAVIEQP